MNDEDVFSGLARFNLSSYEAKAYSFLLINGPHKASDVVKTAGIPQPRIYDVFTSLERKGIIVASSGMKKIYKALPPSEAFGGEIDSLSKYVKDLEHYVNEHRKGDDLMSPNVWILESKAYGERMIESYIDDATTEIIMSAPAERLGELLPKLRSARERGVTICIVFFNDISQNLLNRLAQIAVLKKREGSPPEFLLVDRESAIVNVREMIPGNRYCIMVEEDEMIHIISYYFFFTMWMNSEYVVDFTKFRVLSFSTSWLCCEAIDNWLLHGKKLTASISGVISGSEVEIAGEITSTDRFPGTKQGFTVRDKDRTYTVGGRNAKLEDVSMLRAKITPS